VAYRHVAVDRRGSWRLRTPARVRDAMNEPAVSSKPKPAATQEFAALNGGAMQGAGK